MCSANKPNCLNISTPFYGVFDLNVQVESTTGVTGKSKTKHPRVPRAPRGLLFLYTQVKNALIEATGPNAGNDVCAVFTIGVRPPRGYGFAGLSRRISISPAVAGL